MFAWQPEQSVFGVSASGTLWKRGGLVKNWVARAPIWLTLVPHMFMAGGQSGASDNVFHIVSRDENAFPQRDSRQKSSEMPTDDFDRCSERA